MGCESGDSNNGSMGSSGLIKCARIHNFGSDTSKTLSGPFWAPSDLSICGDGSLELQIKTKILVTERILVDTLTQHRLKTNKKPIFYPNTGIPAGKKRSKLCTGMMKQSFSKVANEMGSLLELTKPPVPFLFCPLKLTVSENVKKRENFFRNFSFKILNLIREFN